MTAHAYAPPGVAPERDRQPRLFALPGGADVDSPQRPIARTGAPLTALRGGRVGHRAHPGRTLRAARGRVVRAGQPRRARLRHGAG